MIETGKNDPTQGDPGIYPKYVVFKHPAEEVRGFQGTAFSLARIPKDMDLVDDFCFVLKPIKDRAARLALAVYAEAVRHEKPRLAAELKEILDDFDGS